MAGLDAGAFSASVRWSITNGRHFVGPEAFGHGYAGTAHDDLALEVDDHRDDETEPAEHAGIGTCTFPCLRSGQSRTKAKGGPFFAPLQPDQSGRFIGGLSGHRSQRRPLAYLYPVRALPK